MNFGEGDPIELITPGNEGEHDPVTGHRDAAPVKEAGLRPVPRTCKYKVSVRYETQNKEVGQGGNPAPR